MRACVRLLLVAALPALAGWCAEGEVVSTREGGPEFAAGQRTVVVAPLGQRATLECRVLRLGDKSVSWVRSSDLQILAHAGVVFTADTRVSAASGATHALRLERLRAADQGRYECQVNTEPKLSLFFNLTVVDEQVPVAVMSVVGEEEVRVEAGRAGSLACEARYSPPPRRLPVAPLDIRWWRGGEQLDLQSGGVSLDTERWAARAVSRLTLGAATPADAGRYQCRVPGTAAARTLRLRVSHPPVADEQASAMQRDEAGAAAGAGAGRVPPPAALLVLAVAAARRLRT